MPDTVNKKQQFITLLHELFQLDQPELDFGFYKIMHARSTQIRRFIDEELSEHIDDAFAGQASQSAEQQTEQAHQAVIDSLGDNAFEGGELKPEYHNVPVGKQYLEALKLQREGGALSDEAQVYDHLYRFFSRYYDQGDFLSTRYRQAPSDTRDAPYSVPYDGREVYLHWANKDQYYIKSSETLRNYGFDLNAAVRRLAGAHNAGGQGGFGFGTDDTPRRVRFQIVDATEGTHGNVKENEQRFFIIHEAEPVRISENELTIQFEYRPDPEKPPKVKKWQATRLAEAEAAVFKALDAEGDTGAAYKQALATPAPTSNNEDRTLLAKHLTQYTARHSMDYFIHKNLGGFLRRELDFYIKNEVMRLDHIEAADAAAVEDYLQKVKVLRKIARRIIEFLAQLEDFQKKLWLKKKFVTETNYCITLDRIPEEFYPEIAANEGQIEEWERLYSISALEGFTKPITEDFLRTYSFLTLDTQHFSTAFSQSIKSALAQLDEDCDGILIHSDNFHGLQVAGEYLGGQVKCTYIDPPYNTSASAILYKNNYRHSSWVTMMRDRLKLGRPLSRQDGATFVSIDKTERMGLEHALDDVYGSDNHIEELIWTQATANSQLPNYSTNHEYVEVYAANRAAVESDADMFRETKPGYAEIQELIEQLRPQYPPIAEIEQAVSGLFHRHITQYKEELAARGEEYDAAAKRKDPWRGIYPYKRAEYRTDTDELVSEEIARDTRAVIWIWSEISAAAPASKQSATTKDKNHPNFRYYKPTHPVTERECLHPRSGWKFPRKPDPNKPDRRSFEGLAEDHRIAWGEDENKLPRTKGFLHEVETNIGTSVFYQYNDGEAELADLFGDSGLFLSPKSSSFVRRFLRQTTGPHDWFVDYFGGSGSSGHAVIAHNREDHGARKYLLVEMGDYFDTVLKPRLQKVVFSKDWKDGKPKPDENGNYNGVSHCFKYLRLESYEDALNNLELCEDPDRDAALEGNDDLRHDYMLRYWLDVETRGSASLLNIEQFADPTNYGMKIKRPGGDESVAQPVDLVETFNWLIGLHVELLDKPRTFAGEFERETDPDLPEGSPTRLKVKGRLKERDDGAHWFRTVEGWVARTPGATEDVDKVLVIWRKLTDDPEQDACALESLLTNQLRINQRDTEFDAIYINGAHGLSTDFEGKHRLHSLEEAFHAAMWAED